MNKQNKCLAVQAQVEHDLQWLISENRINVAIFPTQNEISALS